MVEQSKVATSTPELILNIFMRVLFRSTQKKAFFALLATIGLLMVMKSHRTSTANISAFGKKA